MPLYEVISNTALSAIYTPLYIVNKYLQLPPSINIYKTINPFFKNHWDILNGIINEEDNAFVVADKIRNYLQSVFSFPLTSNDYNPAPEGVDIVEWFCENQQGVYSDFASAFCAFTRAFGVSSRFVNGFNSINITEDFDIIEGTDFFPIKYKNIYCWAEIYVPTEINGGGKWVQIDLFDN